MHVSVLLITCFVFKNKDPVQNIKSGYLPKSSNGIFSQKY